MSIESILDGIKVFHRMEDEAVINEVFHENSYKTDQIREEALVIDVGAHIGTFSPRCAKEKGCVVYAYEPYLPSFSILVKNISQLPQPKGCGLQLCLKHVAIGWLTLRGEC